MKAAHLSLTLFALTVLLSSGGCFVSKSQLTASETSSRVLAEQNRAQLAEIENLKAHTRDLNGRADRAEQELAAVQEQIALDQKRLANYRRQNGQLHEQFKAVTPGQHRLPAGVHKQLVELSKRYPNLHFDPATGVSKLDTDVLFDTAHADLKPDAQAMLGELAHILQTSDAGELKVMVVGHTDNQRIAGKDVRDRYLNNFHLSTSRALAVADQLRRQGLAERRIGVAGFGPHQPVASNSLSTDRQKNRRVEIFVMAPEVPVVGWTESMPGVY